MYFIKRGLNKIGSLISKPGVFINEKASNLLDTDVIEMLLSTVVFVFFVVVIIYEIFTTRSNINTLNIFILFIIALFGISISIGLINLLVPMILNAICRITEPFVYLNTHCNNNLYKDLDGEPRYTTSLGWGVGPNAVVGINYFIEMDKKNNKNGYYKAKYIGK